jgi:5-methylthioadenosine/S-adenosylhomocysteine deaminase
MEGCRDLVLIPFDKVTRRLCGSDVAADVFYGGAAAVDTVVVDGRVKKWGGELVGVDYAQLAREGQASRTYLLERFGVTTDQMRGGL